MDKVFMLLFNFVLATPDGPKAGEYYDPKTDFYVEQEEMDLIQQQFTRALSQA